MFILSVTHRYIKGITACGFKVDVKFAHVTSTVFSFEINLSYKAVTR